MLDGSCMSKEDYFKEYFACDGWSPRVMFKVTGCMERHNRYDRSEQDSTPREDWLNTSWYGRKEWYKEQALIAIAHRLILDGHKLGMLELETFVELHRPEREE